MNKWITAFRLRTLPLSLSSILMGSSLAYFRSVFDWVVFVFAVTTTVFLQILSNLSNDYGDSIYGADSADRQGPDRMVQKGLITKKQMQFMIIIFVVLSLISGIGLLYFASLTTKQFLIFFGIGVLAIIAAVNYTVGMKKPYGYKGLGDISVFVFFGLVGVLGSYYLYTQNFDVYAVLPAISLGFFAVGVLNVNNIRDIESDRKAGKLSIPVRIGREKAVVYHFALLLVGFLTAVIFVMFNFQSYFQFLFVVTIPLFIKNFAGVKNAKDAKQTDPYLKQLAISTFLFTLLFGLGIVLV